MLRVFLRFVVCATQKFVFAQQNDSIPWLTMVKLRVKMKNHRPQAQGYPNPDRTPNQTS